MGAPGTSSPQFSLFIFPCNLRRTRLSRIRSFSFFSRFTDQRAWNLRHNDYLFFKCDANQDSKFSTNIIHIRKCADKELESILFTVLVNLVLNELKNYISNARK